MPERKYSVAEIDRMRAAIRHKFPTIWRYPGDGTAPHPIVDYSAHVEDQLRTYMLNGTDPDELAKTQEPEEKP